MGEIAVGVVGRHLHVEIALADIVGGADQAADRPDQPVGEGGPDPDRRKQQGQRSMMNTVAKPSSRLCRWASKLAHTAVTSTRPGDLAASGSMPRAA